MPTDPTPTDPVATGPKAYGDWRESPLGHVTDQCEAAALAPMIGDVAGLDVLDIGCGDGALAVRLIRAGAQVVGLDPDPKILRAARTRADAARVQIDLVDGRNEALPFPTDSFDVVTAVTVLCFVQDEALACTKGTALAVEPALSANMMALVPVAPT